MPRLAVQASEVAGPGRVDRNQVVVYRPSTVAVARPVTPQAATPLARPVTSPPARQVDSGAVIQARHARELHDLEAAQAKVRATLDVNHQNELRKLPAGVSRQELLSRQAAENKADREEEARQKQILAARHLRERTAGGVGGA